MKLSKIYEPNLYEPDIYDLWEKSESFKPVSRGGKGTYTIVMPPPNANANLHIGYALTAALEDIPSRYHRMKGEATLLLPGADHAGFETQSVFEKQLVKEGKSRFDFSREELYKNIWDFVALNRGNFEHQIRKLGVSCDWSRYTFTLDDKIIKRAYATFKKMWDEGLIYRGERLVNYCTFHRTSFADIEVVYEDRTSPLYYLKYGPFTLATTRPETKFGDTAVAVHPDDKRYAEYVGKVITVEGLNGPFELQVIADDMVDPEFGTGAVKITPAHDINDFEAGKRHGLAMVRVINHDGTMNHMAGKYEGMPVLEARKAVAVDLEKMGLMDHVDTKYTNRVGVCYKCGTVIEPMLMDQWFIDMQPLAKKAIKVLKDGDITFYPDAKKDQLVGYLQGLRDWNISRQIAWGIPIPAFQNVDDTDDWIFDERVNEEILQIDGKTYRRDPDVFDTWFSSSSWPYATLDFPDGQDYKDFYPISLMETGGEILYPWVSRMIMLGLYNTGKIPFKEVYIHGYVMAEDGSKMSKSVGNVVDPLPVIEKYGSDALRMGLITARSAAVNSGYDPRKIEDARNFCNKLWNIARFIEDKLGDDFKSKNSPDPKTAADHWILHKLQQSISEISVFLDTYRFAEAYETLYHTVWDDVADWYIEASKEQVSASVLAYTLETVIKLAHPFAPFLTETIWQTLAWEPDSILAVSSWPTASTYNRGKAAEFEEIKTIVIESRNIIASLQLRKSTLYYSNVPFLKDNAELITRLSGLSGVHEVESGHGLHLTNTRYTCWLDVDHETASRYVKKLQEKLDGQTIAIKRLEGRLSTDSYVKNAPKKLVEETKVQLLDAQNQAKQISEEIKRFSNLSK